MHSSTVLSAATPIAKKPAPSLLQRRLSMTWSVVVGVVVVSVVVWEEVSDVVGVLRWQLSKLPSAYDRYAADSTSAVSVHFAIVPA